MTLDFTTMERSIPYDDRKTKRSKGFLELFHENTISSSFYSLRPHPIWNVFLCQLRQQHHTVPNLCLINLISMTKCWIHLVSSVKDYINLFPPTLTLISIYLHSLTHQASDQLTVSSPLQAILLNIPVLRTETNQVSWGPDMKELCLVACSHETMLLLPHAYIYIIYQHILSEFWDNPFCLSFDDPCDKNDNGDYLTNNRRIEN